MALHLLDLQFEPQYTKLLAAKIVERYHKDNIVLTSHLVAFAAFELLKQTVPEGFHRHASLIGNEKDFMCAHRLTILH